MTDARLPFESFNALPPHRAEALLHKCCGSKAWARSMAAELPFESWDELLKAATRIWKGLSREDWLEAFTHHPRIGEAALRAKFAATAEWASDEQKGTKGAGEDTLKALAQGNDEYERKFGYVFLICATGKSAQEMLEAQRARLGNSDDVELRLAAAEQDKITHIRLEKLIRHE